MSFSLTHTHTTHTHTRTHTHACTQIHAQTHTHAHTHTHTHMLVLVLVFTTAKTGYMARIQGVSQQEATRLVVLLAAGTPALSPHLHGPLSALA